MTILFMGNDRHRKNIPRALFYEGVSLNNSLCSMYIDCSFKTGRGAWGENQLGHFWGAHNDKNEAT